MRNVLSGNLQRLIFAFAVLIHAATGVDAQSYGMAPKPGDPGSHADKLSGIDQNLGATIPKSLEFYDHHNQTVKLGDLIGDKPTILVLAYFRCPQLCNEVLQHLLESMRVMANGGFVCGRDYNVITVGIDPKETYHIARPKRLAFLRELDGRKEDEPGWWFLTAGHGQGTDIKAADTTIHLLADAVGFRYAIKHKGTEYTYKAEENAWYSSTGTRLRDDARDYEYIHAAGIMILSPQGKITQYFMGHSGEKVADAGESINDRPYKARDIRFALVEASDGKVGTKIDRLMMYCYMYDPKSGKYVPIMRTLAIVAIPFVFLLIGIVTLAVRNSRRPVALPPLPTNPTMTVPSTGGTL